MMGNLKKPLSQMNSLYTGRNLNKLTTSTCQNERIILAQTSACNSDMITNVEREDKIKYNDLKNTG